MYFHMFVLSFGRVCTYCPISYAPMALLPPGGRQKNGARYCRAPLTCSIVSQWTKQRTRPLFLILVTRMSKKRPRVIKNDCEPYGRKWCKLKRRGRKRPRRGSHQLAMRAWKTVPIRDGLRVSYGVMKCLNRTGNRNYQRFYRSHERIRSKLHFFTGCMSSINH